MKDILRSVSRYWKKCGFFIDMGKQDVWITFDKRVKETVLGMDILQQVIFIANPYDRKIYFCKDSDDCHMNFKLQTA